MKKWLFLLGAIGGSGVLMSGINGCIVEPRGGVVVEQPYPDDAIAQPPPPPADDVVVGPPPGPDFIWIGGFWVVDRGRYAWRPGYWGHRPHPGAVWIAPRWEHGDRGWVNRRGYWR